MWIRTQNKRRIINSDQIINIFISNNGSIIFAQITAIVGMKESELVTLGEYQDMTTCLEILDVLMIVVGHDNVKWTQLPLGSEIESWLEDSHKMAEKLYR